VVMSVVGAPALLYVPKFIVAGDAAATAQKIAAGEQVYRLLLLGALAGSILFIVLGWSLYHLFESVDRKQGLLLLVLVCASATISIVDVGLLSAPLILQPRAGFLSALTREQLDALALAFLEIRNVELSANEALWGIWLVPFGILVIKSGFIPKIIGVLLLIASVGYVAMSAASIGFPAYAPAVGRVGMLLIQGELTVILWLVIKGVRRGFTSPAPSALAEDGAAVSVATSS
jgi:UPF0716 family protein affecting phage T7 exclusion